jgi:hypothetical protein
MTIHSLGRPFLGSITKNFDVDPSTPVELVPPPPKGYARFVGDAIGFGQFSLPNALIIENTDSTNPLFLRFYLHCPSLDEPLIFLTAAGPFDPGVPTPPLFSELGKLALVICYKGDESMYIEAVPDPAAPGDPFSTSFKLSETHNDFNGSIIEVGRTPLTTVTPAPTTIAEALADFGASGQVVIPPPTTNRVNVPLLRGFFGLGPNQLSNDGDVEALVGTAVINNFKSGVTPSIEDVFQRFPFPVPAQSASILDVAYATEKNQSIVSFAAADAGDPKVVAITTHIAIGKQ